MAIMILIRNSPTEVLLTTEAQLSTQFTLSCNLNTILNARFHTVEDLARHARDAKKVSVTGVWFS